MPMDNSCVTALSVSVKNCGCLEKNIGGSVSAHLCCEYSGHCAVDVLRTVLTIVLYISDSLSLAMLYVNYDLHIPIYTVYSKQ